MPNLLETVNKYLFTLNHWRDICNEIAQNSVVIASFSRSLYVPTFTLKVVCIYDMAFVATWTAYPSTSVRTWEITNNICFYFQDWYSFGTESTARWHNLWRVKPKTEKQIQLSSIYFVDKLSSPKLQET